MSGDDAGSCDSLLRRVAVAPAREPLLPFPDPGARVGRFVLGERLGNGAMGVVFAARDDVLGRDVAVKLLAHAGVSDEARAALLREARSAARIEHPGVATVYDAVETDRHLALVLELVRGKTLRRALTDAGGKLPLRDAIRVVAGVARAVHAAHGAGVVHRDLKPDNVMLTDTGGIKVLDFGLAAALGDPSPAAPSSRSFAGTPGYAAPEVLRGRATPLSDQYALGVMLLEAVSGVRSLHDLERASRAPRSVMDVVERATRRAPDARFASCDDFARALERAGRSFPRRVAAAAAIVAAFGVVVATGLSAGATTPRKSDGIVIVERRARLPVLAAACPPFASSSPG